MSKWSIKVGGSSNQTVNPPIFRQRPARDRPPFSAASCRSPRGQNATIAPPLPVNLAAAPAARAVATILRFRAPRAASPNMSLRALRGELVIRSSEEG
jgi:hypothetical protein